MAPPGPPRQDLLVLLAVLETVPGMLLAAGLRTLAATVRMEPDQVLTNPALGAETNAARRLALSAWIISLSTALANLT